MTLEPTLRMMLVLFVHRSSGSASASTSRCISTSTSTSPGTALPLQLHLRRLTTPSRTRSAGLTQLVRRRGLRQQMCRRTRLWPLPARRVLFGSFLSTRRPTVVLSCLKCCEFHSRCFQDAPPKQLRVILGSPLS
ncbi:hypothetical protein PF005_g20796 [Phytophthora fragariae]|uniref:Secreted protein n=1 Tax=Phytophthora fragariae TaxID=53985 RepID=A0A6A3WQY9_9STRA|nr:hypothetical protein PF003_g17266 [Phytophthora fragariae]KAE8934382.1 hypothetical protein PF009_g15645 [Phytophthora fragariae]KAE8983144.1 hypothetical protein PF011_g21321 [Phytophthora fragariae]KAE9086838.1 hypothetical protein PF007_g20611 [Phytophthora fragariae]KAE9122561.1 hypothetical protein PF006_g17618 [Phytophthora fragariae]